MVTDAGETSMRFRKARLTFIDFTAAVIVVSILTGAAGPRLVPLEEPSREDALHALAGSMRSASALVHAMWQADGGRGNSVDLDGTIIEVDARGFPTRVSIRDALGRDPADARSGFVEVAPRSGVFAPSKTFARGSTVRLHPPRHSSKLFGPLIRHSPGPQQGG